MFVKRSICGFWLVIPLLISITACTKQATQSDSMARLEAAHKKMLSYNQQIAEILTKKVVNAPSQHLPELVYAAELIGKAQQVYPSANIVGFSNEQLALYEHQLEGLEQQLANEAISIIQTMVSKTNTLRSDIADLRNSTYQRSQHEQTDRSISFIGKKYNDDLQSCCFKSLYKIAKLNHLSQHAAVNAINKKIAYLTIDLTNVLKDPEYQQSYLEELATIELDLKQPSNNSYTQLSDSM